MGGPFGSSDAGVNAGSPIRKNHIWLSPSNSTLGNDPVRGRVAHEIGHLIGIDNLENTCTSIMDGTNQDGTRDVNQVQSGDVSQVNRNFSDVDRSTCQNNVTEISGEPTPTPTPNVPLCLADGNTCSINSDCCSEWCNNSQCQDCPGQLYNGLCTETPIVIDVLGNGFNLTNLGGGVTFDLNADGTAERLSWTSAGSDDAWLALDRNSNGSIDNGIEMFGEFTPQPEPPTGKRKNGFIALAEFDKAINDGNGDGIISKQDSVFSALRLWRDTNHNGLSEASELATLKSLGLKSIDLDYKKSKKTDEHGNSFRYRAKVKDTKDSQIGRWAWDVLLVGAP